MLHPQALTIEHSSEVEMDCFSNKQIDQQIKFWINLNLNSEEL